MPRAQAKAQLALDETVVDDHPLEEMLEERERARIAAGEARSKLKDATTLVLGAIAERDELGADGALRIGRFRLERRSTPGRVASFEVAPSTRVVISVVDEA